MPTASPVDLGVVVLYLISVTVIGCRMARRTHTTADFVSAGGGLPGWVVGLSIVGTFVSSISFIANPGNTYGGNWNPFVFSLSLPYAALVATVCFVPYFRNCGSYSAYAHLELRFGRWARIYAAGFNVLYHIGRIGTILFGVSLAVSALVDVPLFGLIIGLGILVILYTLMGGIEAVIWTDVVQSIVLVGGMLVCLGLLLYRIPDGLSGVIAAATQGGQSKLSLGSIDWDFSTRSFWVMLFYGFFINLQNFAADQTYVQRYFAAKSDEEARRSVWIGAIAYLPISAILFFIGTALFAFYSSSGSLPEETTGDAVLPFFIMTELPTGLAGLLIAAILAAAMSTVDSSLNSSSTLLLCDVRNLLFPSQTIGADGLPIPNDQADLKFLRIMTVVLGIAGITAALAMTNVKQMLEVWWKISGALSGGTLGLILLARFTNVRGVAGPLVGVIVGILLMAAITVIPADSKLVTALPLVARLQSWFDPLMAIVTGTLAVFIVGWLLSVKRASD